MMNHALATYIDFVQSLGVVVLIGGAAYTAKQILLQTDKRVDKVNIRIEE